MVYIPTKNTSLGKFWREDVDINYGLLVYCKAIRYILWTFGIHICWLFGVFYAVLVCCSKKKSGNHVLFGIFGALVCRSIWQPCFEHREWSDPFEISGTSFR
jgi:hypothetical protein